MIIKKYIPFIIFLFLSFKASAQSFGKKSVHELTATEFAHLKQVLTTYSKLPLQDTIIIKYDYNNESCWDRLDEMNDAYVMRVVDAAKTRMKKAIAARPQTSFFEFREKGLQINKLKYWNDMILVDEGDQLREILFKKKRQCGNSAIVLPDRKYILVSGDAHFMSLEYSREMIAKLLK